MTRNVDGESLEKIGEEMQKVHEMIVKTAETSPILK